MRILVTRPLREAAAWVERLQAAGHDALALPLIEMVAADTPAEREALAQAWTALAGGAFRAFMFSSAHAAQAFFAGRPEGAAVPLGVRAWAPGHGTRDALVGLGVSAVDSPPLDSGQFDSEHLWPVVRAQLRPGDAVLGVRGADATGQAQGREWLRTQVEAAGAGWRDVVAYRRRCPSWTEVERGVASGAARDAVWLFSSSEGVRNLSGLMPGQAWHEAQAIATHPRIAEAAQALGFGRVMRSQPTLASILASIESLR